MDIRLLRSFVTLAEQGRYHAAADILCVTQPALTKQIQALEQLTGLSLFQRGRQGATLTVAGELLYPLAGELLHQHEEFRNYVDKVKSGSVGRLALGFGISSFQLAPSLVRTFRQHFPEVNVSLNDIPSEEQYAMLLSEQLNAGFLRLPAPAPLQTRVLLNEMLVLAVPTTSVSEGMDIQSFLHRYPLLQISPKRGRGLSDQTVRFLQANNLHERNVATADDIHVMLALVAAGNGVALLPSGARHIMPANVSHFPVSGEHARWLIGIAWNPLLQNKLRDNFIAMIP